MYWGLWETHKRWLWKWASLSIWAPMENPDGWRGSFTRNFEAWMEEGSGNKSLSLYGSCVRRTWREGSSTGDPEGYVNESSRNEHLFQ
jgi:hypothetical protein